MTRTKRSRLKPYTAVSISSLEEGSVIFEKIISCGNLFKSPKVSKPVVLYGAGNLGKMAKNFFNFLHMPFLYVVDNNPDQYALDQAWAGVDIIRSNEVAETDKKNCLLVICIVTAPLIALRDELRAAGWQDIVFFYDLCETCSDRYPLGNGWFLDNLGNKEIAAVKKVFSVLDMVSRMHYLQFLAWRKLRIELLTKNVQINPQNRFFISEIADVLTGNEVFVDCGAHHGSVTETFLKTVHNCCKAIYVIEPDNDNFKVLKSKLKNVKNITMRQVAISDKSGKGNFYQGFDFASKLDERGEAEVDVVALDNFNIPATFIKMHLEGGELDALRGAADTIRKYRPIIAVTGYHNSDGAWEMPLYLIESTENYKFHIRLHSWGGTGAVFYAIPAERAKKGNL